MKQFHYLFHVTAYYLTWLACILFAAHHDAWTGTVIGLILISVQYYWQYRISRQSAGLNVFVILLSIIGTGMDSILLHYGLVTFAANPFYPYLAPPWMITLWISFAVVLYSTLSSLFNRLVLLSILSFFGFSFAYFCGVKMGAAGFPQGSSTAFFIGLIWMVLLPGSIIFYKKISVHDKNDNRSP